MEAFSHILDWKKGFHKIYFPGQFYLRKLSIGKPRQKVVKQKTVGSFFAKKPKND